MDLGPPGFHEKLEIVPNLNFGLEMRSTGFLGFSQPQETNTFEKGRSQWDPGKNRIRIIDFDLPFQVS